MSMQFSDDTAGPDPNFKNHSLNFLITQKWLTFKPHSDRPSTLSDLTPDTPAIPSQCCSHSVYLVLVGNSFHPAYLLFSTLTTFLRALIYPLPYLFSTDHLKLLISREDRV